MNDILFDAFDNELEKIGFLLPAGIGAIAADDPLKGALGGVGGGAVGGLAGGLAAIPVGLAATLLGKSPAQKELLLRSAIAAGSIPGALIGSYRGGQYVGGKRKKKKA
jgi:hypothetical protein